VQNQFLIMEEEKGERCWEGGGRNLLLKLLELVVFLLAVVFYFFLGFVVGVFYALGAVCVD